MGKLAGVFVTGDKELDAILATMADKEIKKAVVQATDAVIKNDVLAAYIANVEASGHVETGAMRDVAKKRRVKRSRTRFGSELFIDRTRVIEMRQSRGGRIGKDKKRNEAIFYPILFEYGDDKMAPTAPLRRALLSNRAAVMDSFRKYLRIAVREVAARAGVSKR
jgi:hypothetical protein